MYALRPSAPFWATLLVSVAISPPAWAQSNDALLGKWRLNVAKSKYSPGPTPTSSVITYAMSGNCLTSVTETVEATGAQTRTEFTCLTLDGRDHPVKESQAFDSNAYTRVDALSARGTRKNAGKIAQTGTRTLSKDGKTLSFAFQGTDARGQKFNNVAVYEKQ